MPITVGDAVLIVGADTTALDRSMKSIGDKMTSMGKNLTLKLTAPLVAFGALSVKTAADFSRAMAKVNAVTGATEQQFEELNNVAKELGRTTQFTATQVAEAMTFMGMAGMDTEQILSAIPDTLNLAAAGALDMGAAANIVTNILAGFGMETEQLGEAVDVLSKAFTSSNTDLLMLGESMKFAGPVAKGFGMSFEETAAIMGIFGNAGIQASLAGTSLRGAIVQLSKKAEEFGIVMYDSAGQMLPMADIIEQIEARGFTASQMMELFGLRAGPAMTALLETGSDALRAFTTELENAGGTAQEIAETQMEGIHGSITRLKSAFEGLQLTIAEYIVPVLESLIKWLRNAFEWFSNLSDGERGMIIKTTVAVAALGPALIILGQAIKAVAAIQWVWNAALAANPVGLVIVGVVALGAAMAALALLIRRNWEGILDFFKRIGQGIKSVFITIAEYMYQPIRTAVDWIIRVINGLIRGINATLGWLGVKIPEIGWRMPPSLFGSGTRAGTGVSAEQRMEQSERERVATPTFGPNVAGYAHGGPILGPTLLTSLRTMKPYAIAGESGPESVVPGGQKVDIHVFLDGDLIGERYGVKLVETIRLRQGVG